MALVFAATAGARAEIDYGTDFKGVDGEPLDRVKEASQLVALEDKHPDSEAGLRRRASSDLDRLKLVMNSLGFYDAALSFTVDPDSDKDKFKVVVSIDPGARYKLESFTVLTPAGAAPPDIGPLPFKTVGLIKGTPALAAVVLAAEPQIARAYQKKGYPNARVTDHEAIIDSATKTMDVTYTLDAGAKAHFGPTAIKGLKTLDPAFVARRITWKPGDTYDITALETTRQALVGRGLFSWVEIAPAGAVPPDGTLPIDVDLVERALHTVTAGGSYDTSLGVSVNLGWEDRDLFGEAEDFTATAKGGQSDSGLNLKFTRPDTWFDKTDFVATISADNQLVEAFRSLHEEIELGFQTRFDPHITVGYSVEAEHARVDEKPDTRVYTLVGLPLFARQDMSNDLLNPTAGYRLGAEFTPYLRALGSQLTYGQLRLNGSVYQRLGSDDTYILAGQAILGATCCTSLDAIPKDHRFYSGGGGSVRGFAFQKAGPLDSIDDPIGGRSLEVASIELRALVYPNIQLVPFLDVGTDGSRPAPTFGGNYYYGAGIGARYFTPIGPIRLDIATPLNPRPNIDSPIALYISIGQAF